MSSVQEHNEMELARLEIGDAVEFKRGIRSHWGLYIGDGAVVHLTADTRTAPGLSSGGVVRIDNFYYVACGFKASKNNYNDSNFRKRPDHEIIATARSKLGKSDYNTLWNNSEDFVNYCKYGENENRQVYTVQQHNEIEIVGFQTGDAVEFKRGLYCHWGLYIGDGLVIHATGESIALACSCSGGVSRWNPISEKAWVRVDGFFDVAGGYKASKKNYNDSNFRVKPVDEIIATALSMEGKIDYNALWNNCEHFVNNCRYGEKRSRQAARGIALAVGFLLGAVVYKRGFAFWR